RLDRAASAARGVRPGRTAQRASGAHRAATGAAPALPRGRAGASASTHDDRRSDCMTHDDRDNHDDVRYVLTEQGMRFLAARAGVPPSTFGEHGAVTYVKEADEAHPARAVRHVAHTLGLNHFMVRLARDAR